MRSIARASTRTRLRRRGGAVAAAILATAALTMPGALASHPEVSLPGSNFEIDTDANIKVDDAAPSLDWANVTEVRSADTESGPTDESFGTGTKEDTAVPSVIDGSIPPNKSDLKFFGVYQEGDTTSGFLNLFWSRVQDPSGTTNMDFEFNKRQCTPHQSPADADCTTNGITPIRSTGDLLVIYDLSKGGTVPVLSIREWTGTEWGPATDLTSSSKATGSINTSVIPAEDSDGLGRHDPRTFGEAQIALSAIFSPGVCESFGSVYLKSRASDSFTAALKDFVPPTAVDIRNCGKLTVHKVDDATPANPLAGAVFTLYTDNDPVGGTRGAEDTITTFTCTTGEDGNCSMTDIPVGSYWVVETTVPPDHFGAPDQATTVSSTSDLTLTFVDPRVLQPTISTAQDFVPNDSATVQVEAGQGDLAGTLRFRLYDNATCDGTALYDSGALDIATGTGSGAERTLSTSNTTAYTTDMTFSWLVEYTSDNDGHKNVTSVCDDEHSSIAIDNDHVD